MARPLRIVVADDDRAARDALDALLTRFGHEVVGRAASGTELVALARATAPDLIVTDVEMPGADGIEAAEWINRERDTPVILVSGYHADDYYPRTAQTYILAFLSKPIDTTALAAAVPAAVDRFDSLRAMRANVAGLFGRLRNTRDSGPRPSAVPEVTVDPHAGPNVADTMPEQSTK